MAAFGFDHGAINWLTTDAATTTYTVSGLSFQPKAIRIYWQGTLGSPNSLTTTRNILRGIGFGVSTSSRRCVVSYSQDGAASTNCASVLLNDCVAATITGTTVDGKLDLNSITSDGFTLVVDDAASVDLTIFWEAWGGDDITVAVVGDIIEPASVGNQDNTVTGFTSDTVGTGDQIVMFAGVQSTAAAGTATAEASGFYAGFGGGVNLTNIVVTGNQDHSSASSDTDGWCGTGACIAQVTEAGGNLTGKASLTQFNTNGFRLNWANRATSNRRSIFLALKGGRWTCVGTTIAGNTLNSEAQIDASTYRPVGACFIGRMTAAQAGVTTTTEDRMSLGTATSTTSRRAMGSLDLNGADPTDINLCIRDDNCLVYVAAGALLTRYDVSSWGDTSVTIINELAGGVASEFVGVLLFAGKPFTGTAAVTTGAATASGSGTFTAPVYTGSSAVTVGATTASGSATFSGQTFTGSAAVSTGAATASGSGTFSIGTVSNRTMPYRVRKVRHYGRSGRRSRRRVIVQSRIGYAPISFVAVSTFTGTAAVTIGAATAAGSATFSPGTKTGTAAVAVGATTASGAATFTAPVYTGTAAVTIRAATASGSATFTAPVYTGTAAVTVGRATAAGSATFTAPVYTGTAAVTVGRATAAGSATFVAPVYTGAAAVTVGAATASGSANFATAIYQATAAVTVGAATAAGSATFTAPVYTGTAAVTVGRATAAGSATFTAPVYTGTAAVTVGAATASGSAAFAASVSLGVAAVTVGATTASATATFREKFTGTAAVTIGAATAAGTATFTVPVYAGTAAVTVGRATASGTATFTAPVYTGVAAVTTGATTGAGFAGFEPSVSNGVAAVTTGAATIAGAGTFVPSPIIPPILNFGLAFTHIIDFELRFDAPVDFSLDFEQMVNFDMEM